MVEIIEQSREFNKVEKYLMTSAPGIEVLKNVPDGTSIPVDGYLIFIDHDKKEDDKEVEILSIITPENKVYSCQSGTFKKSLLDIAHLMDGEPFNIIKLSGNTKAGRPYINCTLDVDSVKG